MFTISKDFSFSASHCLGHLSDNHPCRKLHGHNYKVRVVFKSEELNSIDMVIDYKFLKPISKFLNSQFDHQHLNDKISRPTAENLAVYIFSAIREMCQGAIPIQKSCLESVSVSETDKTWATYSIE